MCWCFFYGEIYLSYLVKEILLGSFNSGLTIVAVRLFNPTFLISGRSLRGRRLEIGREGEKLAGRLKTIINVACTRLQDSGGSGL